MPVLLGARGQPGFDQPLALMSDCHRRIERFLGMLARVLDLYGQRQLDAQAVAALEAASRYFRESAPRHVADEEESLFPRLRTLENASRVLEEAVRLAREHERAQELHLRVDRKITEWVRSGCLPAKDFFLMGDDVELLKRLYARHIEYEDAVLFPFAAQRLSVDEIRGIGREMAARRGIDAGDMQARQPMQVRGEQ